MKSITLIVLLFALTAIPRSTGAVTVEELFDLVEHGYADSDGVKIHYVTTGEGPLVLFIHGFPDLWFTWRHQMAALADSYQVVAIDQRGYNRSDKPRGKANYDIKFLVADVAAVIRRLGREKATIVGHDWGGNVSWNFVMTHPEMTENLIVFNRPHPRGRKRELALNRDQKLASSYISRFKNEEGTLGLTAEGLARRHEGDPILHKLYLEGYRRCDFEAMINYYRQNYPDPPYLEDISPVIPIQRPVLMFHGLDDRALRHEALNRMWEWLDEDLTLITLPGVGHSSHLGPVRFINGMMKTWLDLHYAGGEDEGEE